ncbi:hypothetical protein IAR55_001591 [Kwoniella newhampshirensis]|uniref:HTH CENPB-type domain-containing protein n=1 Tax=Kwoniella newhampshirensis TaxID=1651941 RepID=A0AAW0Z2S6_9TREE
MDTIHSQPSPDDIPSHTPTRVSSTRPPIPDFNSPSAYLEDNFVSTEPITPHLHDPTYAIPAALDDAYGFAYGDYSAQPSAEYVEQTTPSGAARGDEEKTPVVPEGQPQIHPASLPRPPNINGNGDQTIRASSSHTKPSLMSPFKTFQNQQQPQSQQPPLPVQPHDTIPYPLPIEHQQYIDNTAMYYGQQPNFPAFQQTSPTEHMSYTQYPQQFVAMQPQMTGIYPADMYQTQPVYNFPGPPRSRNGSPTSSIASSGASLVRTGSTSSDLRSVRPKVKLTYDDKRNIVLLHRQNSSLRQEDIARMYGVDRSTISKIILSSHRWTQPQEPQAPPVPKAPKTVGGRFPAVEQKLDAWMDAQIASGQEVRDSVAREKAKTFAREIGFPMDRFKASAKWLDKFKDRRKAAGKAVTSPTQPDYAYYAYAQQQYAMMPSPMMDGSVHLSRSQSTATLSSSDSSGQGEYQPVYLAADSAHARMGTTRSESDLSNSNLTPSSRSRSQSSPQVLVEPGMQSPSSGKASKHRPAPLHLQRQNSYHGTSPSPRRAVGLSRTNSIQGSVRRANRPLSLAASAFGFTNMDPQGANSPIQSPSTSGSHSRQRSDVSVSHGLSGMTISPNISENGEMQGMMPMSMSMATVPPLTPITPGHAVQSGIFPNNDYGEIQGDINHYATMPNKHYSQAHYANVAAYPVNDFGPAYIVPPNETHTHWR